MYSFNPCFIGTYSFTSTYIMLIDKHIYVLILVLLELILLQGNNNIDFVKALDVLILVLLELILLQVNLKMGQSS